jgi:serine/threonine protein phosphatase PrpC
MFRIIFLVGTLFVSNLFSSEYWWLKDTIQVAPEYRKYEYNGHDVHVAMMASIQWRSAQEDFVTSLFQKNEGLAWGVFDGHGDGSGGDLVSNLLGGNKLQGRPLSLSGNVNESKSLLEQSLECVKNNHGNLEALKAKWVSYGKEEFSSCMSIGSTAATLFFTQDGAVVAHCGDSGVVAFNEQGEVFVETHDHKPFRPDEWKRIKDGGGRVWFQRLSGSLAVSRAFGDYIHGNAISCEPEISSKCWGDLDKRSLWVLFSDGLNEKLPLRVELEVESGGAVDHFEPKVPEDYVEPYKDGDDDEYRAHCEKRFKQNRIISYIVAETLKRKGWDDKGFNWAIFALVVATQCRARNMPFNLTSFLKKTFEDVRTYATKSNNLLSDNQSIIIVGVKEKSTELIYDKEEAVEKFKKSCEEARREAARRLGPPSIQVKRWQTFCGRLSFIKIAFFRLPLFYFDKYIIQTLKNCFQWVKKCSERVKK